VTKSQLQIKNIQNYKITEAGSIYWLSVLYKTSSSLQNQVIGGAWCTTATAM